MPIRLADSELTQARAEVRLAHGQTQYLSQQWADVHAGLLEERELHEVALLLGHYLCLT